LERILSLNVGSKALHAGLQIEIARQLKPFRQIEAQASAGYFCLKNFSKHSIEQLPENQTALSGMSCHIVVRKTLNGVMQE
jgi:hypothetical protein